MKRQEAQSTRKTSLGSLDPIEKAVVAKFTKQIGNIEEVLSMHDAPDAPVWAANCSYGTEIILAWNRAKRAVMYEIRSEDADWGEEGYVWQGTSTMITLPARTRSETFYIKSINAAGIYSEQASVITLKNEAPSAPVFTLVPSTSGFTVLLSDTESDVVKVVLSITEVDEQQKPLGETVQRVCEEKTYFFATEPRTNWKVSAVAYDSIGAGEESAAKYVTVSGIDAWHIIDIPEHIVSPSHLTESLMEEIESAVDGVDYLDRQMSEAQQRLSQAESEMSEARQRLSQAESKLDSIDEQMSEALQRLSQAESELDSVDGRVTETETKITELEGEIATKVSQTDYDTLVGRVETAETNITQNAQAIATKASQSSVDTLEGRVSTAETTITQQAQEIASKASQLSVDTLEGRVSAAETTITQHAQEIASKASQSSVDTLAGRVETAETNIIQNAQAIVTKASQSSVDTLEGRVSTAEGELTVLADEVAAKVSQSVFDALEQRVTTNEGTLAVHADMIAARVTSEVFDLLEERVETAEGQLTVLADEVSAKVSQTVFDTLVGRVETAEGILEVLPGQINAKADQSVVDTLTGRVEEAEGQLSVLATEIAARVTQEVFDTLEGRVETAEGKLSVLADEISTKVSQTVFDELEGLVSRQGTQIALNTESITGIVTRVDNVEGQVTEHASQIQLLGDEITLKVQVRQDGKLVIAGIGMAVDEDGQSEVAMLADRFRVLTSVDGEMKSVFAVDTETGKVYVLGDLIATGLIRATEVQAEVAKHLLLAAEVATVDHLGALKIEAGAITVGGEAPGISLTKPEGGKLWHFDGSLVSTDGTAPESGAVATLRPGEGRFGGAVAVEEGTTNQIFVAGYQSWFANLNVGDSTDRSAGGGTIRVTRLGEHRYRAEVIADCTRPILSLTNNFTWPANQPHTMSAYILDYYEAPGTMGRLGLGRSSSGNPSLHGADGLGRKTYTHQETYDVNAAFAVRALSVLIKAGTYIEWEFAQVELNKPFATSFVDGTRTAGRLSYPKSLVAGLNALTVAAWTSGPPYWTSEIKYLVAAQTTGTSPYGDIFALRTGNGNRISLWVRNDANSSSAGPSYDNVWDGNWHLIVGVINKSPQPGRQPIELYVDGKLVASSSNVNAVPDLSNIDETWGVQVGNWRKWGQWNGLIDELLILPYAATPEQIQAWYAMGAPFVDPNSAINADASPISAARGQVYIGEPGIAVANGAMIFVSGTFSQDQLGRLITAAVDRPLTTDPGGQKSVSAPVEISAARGVEIYKGKLNVWAGTGGAGDKRYIHDGRVTDDGIIGMDALKLTGTVAMENLPGHLIRTAPGIDGAVMYWGETYVAARATVNITFNTAMPYTPMLIAREESSGSFSATMVSVENMSTTGFRFRSNSDSGHTFQWIALCASDDPTSSSCSVCQEKCQKDCQTGCEDACQVPNSCQGVCEIDCQTTCEGACQDACMFSCQLPPPLTLWE